MDLSQARVGGSVNFWRAAKSSSYQDIIDGLDRLGLQDFAPDPRSPQACLRAAIDNVYVAPKGEKYAYRPVKNGMTGFAVVREPDKDEHISEGDTWGTVIATVGLKEDGELVVSPYDYAKEASVKVGMAGAAKWITAATVGKSLAELIEHLGGVALRPNGAVYWLNEDAMSRWALVAKVFEKASAHNEEGKDQPPTAIYSLSVIANEEMVRAVGDALVEEVDGELSRLEAELAAGNLKEVACLRRVERCAALEEKIKRYEQAMEKPMEAIKEAVVRAGLSAAMAGLQVSASAVTV